MKNESTGSDYSGGDGPTLKIESLSQTFEAVKALINVNLEVARGDVLGLIGPNGSGKTTLLNVITGIYTATRGEIFFQSGKI